MPYQLFERIGQGGMGCVYRGRNLNTGEMVAVKKLDSQLTCFPAYRQMFQQEIATLRHMNHPAVVHIDGNPYQDNAGNLYLPMEYIAGETIEQRVRRTGKFPIDEAVHMMIQILDGIDYIHGMHCIHRDIKPSNVMIRPNGGVCIIDFGIAKDARVGVTGQTVGQIRGTDGYMSPEQASALNIDKRTDIYSLGCLFYFMLTGRHAIPNQGNNYSTMQAVLNSTISLPADLPADLNEIFLNAVNKDMTLRYSTARDFKQALAEFLRNRDGNVSVRVQQHLLHRFQEKNGEKKSSILPVVSDIQWKIIVLLFPVSVFILWQKWRYSYPDKIVALLRYSYIGFMIYILLISVLLIVSVS